MTIIPGDVDRILADRFYFLWPRWLFIHWQQSIRSFGCLAGLAMMTVALFGAGGAGAGVAEPLKVVVSVVAVIPVDVHSGAGGYIDLYGFGVGRH